MADNPIKGKLPFKFVSSSVNTGYQAELSASFKPDIAIYGLHSDEYAGLENNPLQGPFTEQHVGGNQHRHVELNDGDDNSSNRPEAFILSASNSQLKIYGPDFASKNNPRAQLFRGAKSPVNIKNIQTTGSSKFLGNFAKNYEVVQATGRRNFNNLINDGFIASGNLTTQYVTGTTEYSLPEIKNNSKSIFVERFSAPGSKEDSSRGSLDREGEEYSPNNSLTTRNIKVRQSLYSQLTKHTPQFGSSSLGGITEHKVHRNTAKRIQYSGSDIVTGLDYDNFWVQHAIPRSDMQYSWITASANNSIFEYEKLDVNGRSEDIDFQNTSYAGENSIEQDINGLKRLNKENFNIDSAEEDSIASKNLLNRDSQYPNFSYFNGLYQHSSWKQIRTGEHPVARKLKADNIFSIPDPINPTNTALGQVISKRSNSLTAHKEPPITNKFKPITQNVVVTGSRAGEQSRLKYSFANERSGFANKAINTKLGTSFSDSGLFDKIVSFFGSDKSEGPFEENVSLEYSETVYPSEKNTFLAETRERTGYILDQAGTGSDGYDKVFGTQRTYWRENQDDRRRTPFEALNSQGYKNIISKFSEQSSSNYYSQILYNGVLVNTTQDYGNNVSFEANGNEIYGIIGSPSEKNKNPNLSDASDTGSVYFVNTINRVWQIETRLNFNYIKPANLNVTSSKFGTKTLIKNIDGKWIIGISDPNAISGSNNNVGLLCITSSNSFPDANFTITDVNYFVTGTAANKQVGQAFDIVDKTNLILTDIYSKTANVDSMSSLYDMATSKYYIAYGRRDAESNAGTVAILNSADNLSWNLVAAYTGGLNSNFGSSIKMLSSSLGLYCFIGADSASHINDQGSVSVISSTNGTSWSLATQILQGNNYSNFGNSIDSIYDSNLQKFILIVGAYNDDNGNPSSGANSGSVYFTTSSDGILWSPKIRIISGSGTSYCGTSVSLLSTSFGYHAYAAAYLDDFTDVNLGNIYFASSSNLDISNNGWQKQKIIASGTLQSYNPTSPGQGGIASIEYNNRVYVFFIELNFDTKNEIDAGALFVISSSKNYIWQENYASKTMLISGSTAHEAVFAYISAKQIDAKVIDNKLYYAYGVPLGDKLIAAGIYRTNTGKIYIGNFDGTNWQKYVLDQKHASVIEGTNQNQYFGSAVSLLNKNEKLFLYSSDANKIKSIFLVQQPSTFFSSYKNTSKGEINYFELADPIKTLVQITASNMDNIGFGYDLKSIKNNLIIFTFVSAPNAVQNYQQKIYLLNGTASNINSKEIANIGKSIDGYGKSIDALYDYQNIYLLIGSPLEDSGSGKVYIVSSSDDGNTFSNPLQLTYPSTRGEYFGSYVKIFKDSYGVNFAASSPNYNNCGATILYKPVNGQPNTVNYEIFGESSLIGDNFGKSFDVVTTDSETQFYVGGDYGNSKRGNLTQVTNATKNVNNVRVSDFGLSIYPIDKINGINNYEIYNIDNRDNTYSLVKNFTLNDGGEFNKEILTKIELSYFSPATKLENIISHNASNINSLSVIYDANNSKYIAAYSNYTSSNYSYANDFAGSVTLLSKSINDSSWGTIKTYKGNQLVNLGTSLKLISSSYGLYCFMGADHSSSVNKSGSLYYVKSIDSNTWSDNLQSITTGSNLSNFGNSLDALFDNGKFLISVGAYKDGDLIPYYSQSISNVDYDQISKSYLVSKVYDDNPLDSINGLFGQSIAISGNYLFVGKMNQSVPGSVDYKPSIDKFKDVGIVEMFTKDLLYGWISAKVRESSDYYDNNSLTRLTYFAGRPASTNNAESFGRSMAISGNTLFVGAHTREVNGTTNAGVVYMFTSSNNYWSIARPCSGNDTGFDYEITGASNTVDNLFGSALAISGNYLFVGSEGMRQLYYDNATGTSTTFFNVGSVLCYYSGSAGWKNIKINNSTTLVRRSEGILEERFGCSLAISGNYLAIGAFLKKVSSVSNAGAFYVYNIDSSTNSTNVSLTLKQSIDNPFPSTTNRFFGFSLAFNDVGQLLVGVPSEIPDGEMYAGGEPPPSTAGTIYVYESSSAGWQNIEAIYQNNDRYLQPPNLSSAKFGEAIAVSGNYMYASARNLAHNDPSNVGVGGVYEFNLKYYKTQQGRLYIITSSNGIGWSDKQKIAEGNLSYDPIGGTGMSYGIDYLGTSVSLLSCSSGYQSFVAASYEDDDVNTKGDLYVLTSSNGDTWSNKILIARGNYSNSKSTSLGVGGIKAVNFENRTYVFFAESSYDTGSNDSNDGAVFVISSDLNNRWTNTTSDKVRLLEGLNTSEYLPTSSSYSNLISAGVYTSGSGANLINRLYYVVGSPAAKNSGNKIGKVFIGYTDNGTDWKKFISSERTMTSFTGSIINENFGTVIDLLINNDSLEFFTANNTNIFSASLSSYSNKKAYEEYNVSKNLFSVSNMKIMPANLNNLAIPSVKYINNVDGLKYDSTTGEKSSVDFGLMRTINNDNQPFYDSYGEFIEQARGTSKEYSILPEFRISEHMDYYLNNVGSNFLSTNLRFLTIDGAKYSSSLEKYNFKTQYMIGDTLVESIKINNSYSSQLKLETISLKINGIKKLLPYNGFYPIQRTIQLANLFSSSYMDSVIGGYKYNNIEYSGTTASEKAKWYAALQPFFAPGILYNTIKSGIAVDFPVFTGSIPPTIGSTNDAISFGLSGTYGAEKLDVKSIISDLPNYRFPFESIINPSIAINKSDNIPIYYTINYNSSSYNIYPYFKLLANSKKNYTLAMSNFLAESIRFFLEGDGNSGSLTSIYSKPQSSWQFLTANKTYYMDVKLRKNNDLVIMEAYHSDIHETGLYGQKMNGRYFGFPMSLSTSNSGDPNLNYGYCDPAYAAYTPPYFEGESVATIQYTPTSSGKPTLDDIVNGAKITYKNTGLLNYIGSNAANSKMKLDASVNLLGQFIARQKDNQNVLTNIRNPSEDRLIIHTKYETPVLDFSNQKFINGSTISDTEMQHGGFGRGMWSGYGEIPKGESIVLEIGQTYANYVYRENSQTGSLMDALGFVPESKNIGIVANKRVIYEAIVAIPYLEQYEQNKTINMQIFKDFGIYPIKLTPRALSAVSGTAKELQDAMKNYVFPPEIDFANLEDNSKYAAYVFEIKETLDQQELVDIWQGLMPNAAKVAKQIGGKYNLSQEDMFEIQHENTPEEVLGVYADSQLPPDLKWFIFKVKKKGEYDYFKITQTIKDDKNLQEILKDPRTGADIKYSYNWPYDFFSLVESAKLDVTLKYKKKT